MIRSFGNITVTKFILFLCVLKYHRGFQISRVCFQERTTFSHFLKRAHGGKMLEIIAPHNPASCIPWPTVKIALCPPAAQWRIYWMRCSVMPLVSGSSIVCSCLMARRQEQSAWLWLIPSLFLALSLSRRRSVCWSHWSLLNWIAAQPDYWCQCVANHVGPPNAPCAKAQGR